MPLLSGEAVNHASLLLVFQYTVSETVRPLICPLFTPSHRSSNAPNCVVLVHFKPETPRNHADHAGDDTDCVPTRWPESPRIAVFTAQVTLEMETLAYVDISSAAAGRSAEVMQISRRWCMHPQVSLLTERV